MATELTKQDVIEDIQSVADEHDFSPKSTEYEEYGEYCYLTAKRKFGSWEAALDAAGLDNPQYGPRDRELIQGIHDIVEITGPKVRRRDMDEHGEYRSRLYTERFGSWANAVEKAGLLPHHPSQETLISEIRRVSKSLKKTPTLEEIDSHSYYSFACYTENFSGWNEALEAAGLSKNYTHNPTKSEIVAEIKRVGEVVGGRPSQLDFKSRGNISHGVVRNKFGSWNNGVEAAGFDSRERGATGEENANWRGGRPSYYGPNWHESRRKTLRRDGHRCARCGITAEEHKKNDWGTLHVHHRIPIRKFKQDDKRNIGDANKLSNLVTLCRNCHNSFERMPVQPIVESVD